MLDTDDIERIRASWAEAAADPERLGQAFYANLFRIDPSTKPLFAGDIARQARKLAQFLTFIVDHLEDSDALLPAARDLAVRHVGYNVVAAQYASVGAALITSLRQMLGRRFTPEDEAAWGRAYAALSGVMIAAAYAPEASTEAAAPPAGSA
jgi:hemoglobin-like flavoprotein